MFGGDVRRGEDGRGVGVTEGPREASRFEVLPPISLAARRPYIAPTVQLEIPMDMPKPGPGHEKMKVFVGEWRGKETMHPTQWMPEGGVRDAVISNRLALDGFAVVQDYVQSENGKPQFQGHAVIVKHPQADSYQMHWFDAFSPSLFEGTFDGVKGVFVHKSGMGDNRATFDFFKPGHYRFKMEMSQDGKSWTPMMDGAYAKA